MFRFKKKYPLKSSPLLISTTSSVLTTTTLTSTNVTLTTSSSPVSSSASRSLYSIMVKEKHSSNLPSTSSASISKEILNLKKEKKTKESDQITEKESIDKKVIFYFLFN